MNKTQESLELAIKALEASTNETIQHDDYFKLVDEAHKACKEALTELSIQWMAENAKELGLDY